MASEPLAGEQHSNLMLEREARASCGDAGPTYGRGFGRSDLEPFEWSAEWLAYFAERDRLAREASANRTQAAA